MLFDSQPLLSNSKTCEASSRILVVVDSVFNVAMQQLLIRIKTNSPRPIECTRLNPVHATHFGRISSEQRKPQPLNVLTQNIQPKHSTTSVPLLHPPLLFPSLPPIQLSLPSLRHTHINLLRRPLNKHISCNSRHHQLALDVSNEPQTHIQTRSVSYSRPTYRNPSEPGIQQRRSITNHQRR